MNPKHLFALSLEQKKLFDLQPDLFTGDYWSTQTDEYELPPYLGKSGFRFWYNTQNTNYAPHWHNSQEIIIPLEENFTVDIQGTVYELEPGDIFLIPSGEIHSLIAPEKGSRFIFLLELNLLNQLPDFINIREYIAKPVHISTTTCPSIYQQEISIIMKLVDYYWSNRPTKQLYIYSGLLEFYACFTDYFSTENSHSSATASSVHTQAKLDLVISYLETHYSEKLTLQIATQISGLSASYFARAFKQYTGHTYVEFIDILRVRAAQELLKNSTIPISKVATSCGFFTSSSFNRSFMKQTGYSPSKFRQLKE